MDEMSANTLAPAYIANETSGESAPPPAIRNPALRSNSSIQQQISTPSPPKPSNSTPHGIVDKSPPPDFEPSPPIASPPPPPTSSSGSGSPPPNPSPILPPPLSPPSHPSNGPPPSSTPPSQPPPPPHAPPLPPPNTNNQSSFQPSLPPTPKPSPPSVPTPMIMSPPPNYLLVTPSLPKLPPPTQVVNPKSPPVTPPSPPLPLPPPNPSTPMKPPPSTPSNSKPHSSPSKHADSPYTESPPSDSSNSTGSSRNATVLVAFVVLVVVAIVAFAIFFIVLRRNRRMKGSTGQYRPPSNNFPIELAENYYHQKNITGHSPNLDMYYSSKPPSSPPAAGSYGSFKGHSNHAGFMYEELMDITNRFSQDNIIGEGGFGCVYKGCLPNGRTVAVKKLKAGTGQGEREFRAEVEIISRVHHRHLVSLVGYCISENHRLLVYEFVPNKTLEHHLHGKELPVMDWARRVKIAIGSARGLAYLHEDCHPRIIHRDIKSANILLDSAFEAQVADFGLAKLTNDAYTHVSTRVMGTFGYMAPEYASSGKLTDKSDVFSFGVVLLELITGRKPVDPSQPLGDESLVEWARPLLVRALENGDCEDLVDPRLENNFGKGDMLRMIEVATACVRHSAPKRPRMVQALRALDSDGDLTDLSNGVKFGQSMVYDSSQYSVDILNFRKMAFGSEESSSGSTYSGESRNKNTLTLDPQSHRELSSGEYKSSQGSTSGRGSDASSEGNHLLNGRGSA